MLKVKKRRYSEIDRRIWFVCPECGDQTAFFDYQERKCHTCGIKLPLLIDIIAKEEDRIAYYNSN